MKEALFGLILLAICLSSLGIVTAFTGTPPQTASVTVGANIGASMEISAQAVGSSQSPWVLTKGQTNTISSTVTITTNGNIWSLFAADTTPGTSHPGHLTSGIDYLSNNLKINNVALTGSANQIATGSYTVTQPTLTFSQTVATGETPHSNYKMTITYTGTASAF